MVGLTRLDSNQIARLIRYRKEALFSPVISASDKAKSTDSYVNKYGEIARRKLKQPQVRLLNAQVQAVIEEYQSGVSTRALAAKYGCHRNTISHHLKNNGVTVTNKKIATADDAAEIVRLYKSGRNTAEIAEQFGVTYPTVIRHLHASGVEMRTRWDY